MSKKSMDRCLEEVFKDMLFWELLTPYATDYNVGN
jgi:hypothetical protein